MQAIIIVPVMIQLMLYEKDMQCLAWNDILSDDCFDCICLDLGHFNVKLAPFVWHHWWNISSNHHFPSAQIEENFPSFRQPLSFYYSHSDHISIIFLIAINCAKEINLTIPKNDFQKKVASEFRIVFYFSVFETALFITTD